MITSNDLQAIGIFEDLPLDTISAVIPRLAEKHFPAGTTIIYRGDPGYSMFMILSGTVNVTLINDEKVEYVLTTQKPGDVFGEIALMTGEPRSANVKALTDVRLAELSQEVFLELVTTFPKLNENLLRLLMQRKARSTVRQQYASLEREEIIAKFLSRQDPDIDHFIGKTKWTTDTNTAIAKLATAEGNVLILGERGTGKDLAARLIHMHGPVGNRPLYRLDCANPPPVQRDSGEGNNEKDVLHFEIAQESALFGHSADAGSYAKGIRRGYLELADGGSIILENIDFLSHRVQRLLVQFYRSGVFTPSGGNRQIPSKVRLIATTAQPLEKLKEEGGIEKELLDLAGVEILQLKPLRERKKDIPVIAEYFVSKFNEKFSRHVTGFSKEAMNLIVDHDWPLNVDELRQVIERAVVIAEVPVINVSQIFLNLPTFSTTGKFNILKFSSVRDTLSHRLIPAGLKLVTVPFILLLIIYTLVGPPEHNLANLVVWAIWWPFLIFSIFFSARSWCGYCPLPVVGEYVGKFRKGFRSVPGVLIKYGIWIGVVGFILILQTEHLFNMFNKAHATGVLLVTILSGAVFTTILFGKRSWCKHICPLGRMVAQYSTISMLELGSNSNVCTSQCQTHDCVREGNCPMGIHPSAASSTKDCVLCFACMKSCQHRSVRIDARYPWQELLNKQRWELSGATFAVLLTASVLAVKLPQSELYRTFVLREPILSHSPISGLVEGLPILIAFVVLMLAASGLPFKKEGQRHFIHAGYTYQFLGFAGFFNIYLHEFIYNGHNLLPWMVNLFSFGSLTLPDALIPNLGTLKALLPLITLAGGIASLLMLKVMADKYEFSRAVYRGHQAVMVFVILVFLIIL